MREANVDEVFVDLCRQIIRKDNTAASSVEEDLVYRHRHGGRERSHGGRHGHRPRGKGKRDRHCVIL